MGDTNLPTNPNQPLSAGKESGLSRTVARFEIRHTGFLDTEGRPLGPLPDFARDSKTLTELYRWMLLTRTFDTKAIALQRTGKMGTYASSQGQEAISVAIGSAMRPEDVLLPTYREYGAQFQRGVAMRDILLYWGGDERGMCFQNQPHDFPIAVPIATQVPHAAGVAYALKLRKQPRVALCTLGDGASSKGDFYEGMNLAGAWQLPMVIVVTNNQWAISVPREAQTHAETLAQKAIAAGIPGEQVDGNDIIAVRHCVAAAVERARAGGGPSLIEALTYRMSDHTTADDASRYRSPEEVEQQKQSDPIDRLRKYLVQSCGWSEQQEKTLREACSAEVEAAVQAYLATAPMAPESMFDYLYATLPKAFEAQREELIRRRGEGHE